MTARRWGALDAARGFAVLAMVAFHLTWDLGHFGYIDASIPWSAPVKGFGHAIAFSFLFVAGVSLTLAHRDGVHWRAYWRRLAIVAGAAGMVSLGTYIVFPSAFVFFGILHCIAAASLLSVGFLFLPPMAAVVAGALFIAAPHFLASPLFNSAWLQWLGLATTEPLTQDWRPLFPWAGAMLLGVAAGRLLLSRQENTPGPAEKSIAPADEPLSWLRSGRARPKDETKRVAPLERIPQKLTDFCDKNALQSSDSARFLGRSHDSMRAESALGYIGRHSLLIYLAHQPLLFAAFTGLLMIAPPPETAAGFVAECVKSCREEGADQGFCHEACICTAEEATRSQALVGVTDDAERGKELQEIAGRCIAARK